MDSCPTGTLLLRESNMIDEITNDFSKALRKSFNINYRLNSRGYDCEMNVISMFIPRADNEIFAGFTGLVNNGEKVRASYTV